MRNHHVRGEIYSAAHVYEYNNELVMTESSDRCRSTGVWFAEIYYFTDGYIIRIVTLCSVGRVIHLDRSVRAHYYLPGRSIDFLETSP